MKRRKTCCKMRQIMTDYVYEIVTFWKLWTRINI